MRFAVDSSVLIGFLRNADKPEVRLLRQMIVARDANAASRNTIVLGDLVLCEVLRGIPDKARARFSADRLAGFESAILGGHDIAVFAANIYRDLRLMGITIYPVVDLMIAAWCIRNDCALLHADRDFDPIEVHFGLRVVR